MVAAPGSVRINGLVETAPLVSFVQVFVIGANARFVLAHNEKAVPGSPVAVSDTMPPVTQMALAEKPGGVAGAATTVTVKVVL